jgi:site-specific DNA-methyltransferase (adenine-specific)
MVSHWFGMSQWQLPNETDYLKLQALFSMVAVEKQRKNELARHHHELVATLHLLNRKYSELLEDYKSLRRQFTVSSLVPYTDVWTHKPVQFYPGKHPCEKPADMLQQIIAASSRPGISLPTSSWVPVQRLKKRSKLAVGPLVLNSKLNDLCRRSAR